MAKCWQVVGLSKKESRLQFTDKERADPYLGESVRKAEKAAEEADKAQQRIPKKKVVKSELIADNSNGKIKVKLHFEDTEKKPPSKLNVASQEATRTAMRRRMQKELRQNEDDNAGIDAADAGMEAAESASQTFREVHRSVRMKPYRDAEKAERKLEKANIEYFQKKAEIENPTSNPFSKWRQKQEIKRQYAAAKAGHTVSGSTAVARNTAKAAKKAVKNTEESASFVVRQKKGIAIILGFLLMLSFLLNAMSSCSMIVEGVVSGIAATSYAAEDDSILGAEAAYCDMEAALQNKLDTYESTHDYHEYHYDLDEIWHDPYVLTAILSALHPGEWTLPEVMGTLDMLFEKQYILTETVETETRYRTEVVTGERHAQDPITGAYLYDRWGDPIMEEYEYEDEVPYDYYICTITLENFDLSHVPVYVMSEDQLSMYALYMASLGNRPDLFPDSEYIRLHLIDGYTNYDIPPDALEDAEFAAMIKEAEKYLGYPYVWGGSNPSTSFDCSGFVSWVLNHSGWNVGRLSAQGLYNICTPVARSNARPGDLVFFVGTYDTPGVSHVGIYVGNSMMIHCGDPITYANINTVYWQSHFYTYGRLP